MDGQNTLRGPAAVRQEIRMQERMDGPQGMIHEGLVDHIDYAEKDIVYPKAEMMKTDLDLQTANTEDLRVRLEQTENENEALKSQLSAANQKLSEMEPKKAVGMASYLLEKVTDTLVMINGIHNFLYDPTNTEEELKTPLDVRQTDESCHQEELETSSITFLAPVASREEEEDRFMADRLQWEEEKASLLQEIRDSRVAQEDHLMEAQLEQIKASFACQLNQQKMDNQKLQNDLKETMEQLKTQLERRQRDKRCHLEELENSESMFLAQVAIHKKEMDQFMANRLQWEQEKAYLLEQNRASCVARLQHQKKEAYLQDDLLTMEVQLGEIKASFAGQVNQQKMDEQKLQNALKETEEELKTHLDQRQSDKICHLEELERSRSTFLAQVAIHKKETDQFMADRLQWEQEKDSLLENRDSCVGQINQQNMENQKLQNALKETEEELKTQDERRQRDTRDNLERLVAARNTFQALLTICKEEMNQCIVDRLEWEEERVYLEEQNIDSYVALTNHQEREAYLENKLFNMSVRMEEMRASFLRQLNRRKIKNKELQNALKKTMMELKTHLNQRQSDKRWHLEELRKYRSTFLAQVAICKNKTDQFMADRLQWEQEKVSLLQEIRASSVARLNHKKDEVDQFAAALINAEQHFEGFQEWREEKSTLTRVAEELKQTLQKKVQESESKEAVLQEDLLAVKTQLEDLQRKVAEKKRNKWYRFSGTLFTPCGAAANPLTD